MSKALFARLSFVAACALAWAGCTVKEVEAPPLSGPSDFALSFQITATPDSLSQDGGSQSTVVVRAFDANGAPKSGARFRLDMFAGGVAVDYGTLSFGRRVRQLAGRSSQAQPPSFDTVACGSGSGVSVKQPPAMPVRDDHPSAFHSRVVPQAAQNQRRCGFVPVIS